MRRVDVFQLSRTGGEASGTVDARQLPRLADQALDDRPSTIRYRIQGTKDGRGRPALDIAVEGEVHVACQRCLQPMTLPLARRTLLVVASTQAELEAWDRDEQEVALADHPASAADLVEDEVLLTLPLSPRHESGECAGTSRTQFGGES